MAKKNELKAKVTADVSDYNTKMKTLGATASSAADKVKIALLAAGVATVALGVQAFKTGIAYQDLLKRMQGVFGLAEGKNIFDKLAKAAQSSALDTQDLVESFIRFSALTGTEPGLDLIESLGFAAKVLGKDVAITTEQFARFFNRLEKGEAIDKDLRDALVGAFGKDGKKFMNAVSAGTINAEQAMKKLLERGKELRPLFETGVTSAFSKLKGVWDEFMLSIATDENLELLNDLLEQVSVTIKDMAASGEIKELSESIGKFMKSLSAEDIANFVKAMTTLVAVLAKALEFFAKFPHAIANLATLLLTLKAVSIAVGSGGVMGLFGGGSAVAGGGAIAAGGGAGAAAAAEGAAIYSAEVMATASGATAPIGAAGIAGSGALLAGTAVAGFQIGELLSRMILPELFTGVNPSLFGKPSNEEFSRMRTQVIEDRRGALSEEAYKRWIANLPPGPPAT